MTQVQESTATATDSRPVAAYVREAIIGTLRRRKAARGTLARKAENNAKRAGTRVWLELKRHPYVGVVGLGVGGVALASVVGVAELAIGVAFAYGAFNVLVRGESPEQAASTLAKELEDV